jgi:alpha-tubulin suppressor-like RCC1 family protein
VPVSTSSSNIRTWSPRTFSSRRHALALLAATVFACNLPERSLGSPTTSTGESADPVARGDDWVPVTASLGIREDGTLWGWGLCKQEWCPLYDPEWATMPVQLGPPWNEWIAVTGGGCALRANGEHWCSTQEDSEDGLYRRWRLAPELATEETEQSSWSDWVEVSVWARLRCGLRADGTLWCWGHVCAGHDDDIETGGFGDGTTTCTTEVARQVIAAAESGEDPWTDWTAVSTWHGGACGLRANGTLWCWGWGNRGSRGDGTTETVRTTPTQVLAALETGDAPWSDWVAVAGTCGLRVNGTLWCWGDGSSGQRGDGSTTAERTTPAQVVAAQELEGAPWSDWIAVSVGSGSSCGLRANGTLWCWGFGRHGQRGDGSATERRSTPRQVLAEAEPFPRRVPGEAPWSDWVAVSPGLTSCGLRADGSAWCWGLGRQGNLGDGTTTEVRTTPARVIEDM